MWDNIRNCWGFLFIIIYLFPILIFFHINAFLPTTHTHISPPTQYGPLSFTLYQYSVLPLLWLISSEGINPLTWIYQYLPSLCTPCSSHSFVPQTFLQSHHSSPHNHFVVLSNIWNKYESSQSDSTSNTKTHSSQRLKDNFSESTQASSLT